MNPFIRQLFNVARNTAGRALTRFDVQTRRNMGPQIRRVIGEGALNPYAHPIVSAAKKDPSKLTAVAKATLAAPGAKSTFAYTGGLGAVSAANKTGLTGAIEGSLNQIGPGLDRFFGAVIPKGVQDFGNSMEQLGWGALGGVVPGELTAASRSLNAIDTGKYGPTDWNPSANPLSVPPVPVLPPSSGGAADRAYQRELSRTAQLTAQDQLSKKYQVAELTKAYNTASPEEKNKIGLQIWATTNPDLARELRPGQTGYSEAVSAFQSQSPLGAITKAAGGMQYADLSQKPITTPMGPGGVPFGFSPAQLQTPLTGIEIPPTDMIGVKEFFSDTKPAPGAMEAFTEPLRLFSPEKLDETKRALLIQAFNKGLK